MQTIEVNVTEKAFITYPVARSQDSIVNNAKLIIEALDSLNLKGKILLACTGSSGLIPAVAIHTLRPDIKFILVRKDEEHHHGSNDIITDQYLEPETLRRRKVTVFTIDDFIATGLTMTSMIDKLSLHEVPIHGMIFTRAVAMEDVDSVMRRTGTKSKIKYLIHCRYECR